MVPNNTWNARKCVSIKQPKSFKVYIYIYSFQDKIIYKSINCKSKDILKIEYMFYNEQNKVNDICSIGQTSTTQDHFYYTVI